MSGNTSQARGPAEAARAQAQSSFVIATRNRPDDLLHTVRSLVAQTVLPAELVVVDSSDGTPTRREIEELCSAAGIKLDYHHPAPRGLTVQRNVGIDRSSGDPVFFVDDDVWMDPDCHEQVLKEYEKWGPELGGVRATPKRPARPSLGTRLYRKLFGIGGWWPEASGKVRPGFYAEGVSDSAGVRRLEYFNGWFMSYRREVFDHERFDEALAGYGYKEDIDFSYRVSRRYVLVQTPKARCDHLKSGASRLNSHQLQRMNLANQFYLHRKLMPQTAFHKAALWWAWIGLFILNVGKAAQTRDPGLVTGMVAGAWEQIRGRGLVDPAAEARAARA
ncbi:MAG TPA: glycosyltransferase family 2 protein [Actinomycetota bacterium]|nr:glycosyltransferase family 2 protein [Actinomycetota bacterium]